MKKQYVTAFPGRRDSYQIPLALSAHGRLAAFATCFYEGKGVMGGVSRHFRPFARRFEGRRAVGLESAGIHCLEFTNVAARVGQRLLQPSKVAVWEDEAFARRAHALARMKKAGLLLYEFQADWAFRQPLSAGAAKILFQFHPHPDLEHPLLFADAGKYPQFLQRIRQNTRSNLAESYRAHTREAWRHADHVMVASEFTARSLCVAGCPRDKISVVPYGCELAGLDVASDDPPGRPLQRPYFLYVGSGAHRKGLHHLLEAWAASRLRDSHELVVIARVVEPELRQALAAARSVRHLAGVPARELKRWFSSARAFVMPTLSEGFGHVFLEALACGCPVIGTRNSMLPDFSAAQGNIRYVEPGNVDSIRTELEWVGDRRATDSFFDTAAIRNGVRGYTWGRFRDGIEKVLQRFD